MRATFHPRSRPQDRYSLHHPSPFRPFSPALRGRCHEVTEGVLPCPALATLIRGHMCDMKKSPMNPAQRAKRLWAHDLLRYLPTSPGGGGAAQRRRGPTATTAKATPSPTAPIQSPPKPDRQPTRTAQNRTRPNKIPPNPQQIPPNRLSTPGNPVHPALQPPSTTSPIHHSTRSASARSVHATLA